MSLSGAPRLLTLRDAAEYCGMPVRNFKRHIGIAPVKLGPHELWDRAMLDAYIDALQGKNSTAGVDWADAIQRL